MSLSEAFAAVESAKGTNNNCKTCRWYDKLDPEDRKFFDRKVADPDTNQATLRKACEPSGLQVAPSSFRSHLAHHKATTEYWYAGRKNESNGVD